MVYDDIEAKGLKFYGSTTIGERGQIVIPSEARKDFEITPSTKLLVFGSLHRGGLMIVKAEFVTELLAKATEMLRGLENAVKNDQAQAQPKSGPPERR